MVRYGLLPYFRNMGQKVSGSLVIFEPVGIKKRMLQCQYCDVGFHNADKEFKKMDYSKLQHWRFKKDISIRNAALLLAGIEPKTCYISFEPQFGPIDIPSSHQNEEHLICAAHNYFDEIKKDINTLDSGDLEVTRLGIGKAIALVSIADISTAEKNEIKAGIQAEVLRINERTEVTVISVARWAASRDIQSVFSELIKQSKNIKDWGWEDTSDLVDILLNIENPYMSPELRAALEAFRHVCNNGTKPSHTYKQEVEQFLKKHPDYFQFDGAQFERIGTLLNIKSIKSPYRAGVGKKGWVALNKYMKEPA